MTDTDKRLATALTNSPSRVYKTTRDFVDFLEEQKVRVKEAADLEISSHLATEVNGALEQIRGTQSQAEDAAQQADEARQDTVQLRDASTDVLDQMKEMLNIATDVAWGGTYDKSSQDDHKTANRLRLVAFGLYVLAVGVAVGFAWWTSRTPPDGWEWLVRSFIGGPVAILLWAAAYASRESREHRNSARLFKHQSLAFISLDRYAKRIEETEQTSAEAAQFLRNISDSLFTNQIDAHVEQIKTQGRTGRFALRLLRERADRN